MKCFKNLKFTNFLCLFFLLLLTVAGVYWIFTYNKMSFWAGFACMFVIAASVFAFFFICYKESKVNDENTYDKLLDIEYWKLHFLNVISIALVVIVIISILINTMVKLDFEDVTATDFFGTFIALCTTFIVGFQIYSSIDFNKKIEKLDKEKRQIEKQVEELNKLNKRCEYFNAYSIGTIRYNEASMKTDKDAEYSKRYCWNAFRAYCNALRLAAEGGQNFHEAWDSFGSTKMIMCLNELTIIHEQNKYDENSGGKDCVMPSYKDRIRYVIDIMMYMELAEKAVRNSEHISHDYKISFRNLVNKWREFKTKYYADIN